MTSVSVAMATYNGGRHIRRQLDSLAAQTHIPAELVVTDDTSTDETLTIVDDFAKTAPFPVLVHRNPTRLGYRGNFMYAASLCQSDLIAFCDQDDIWYPNKIAEAVKPFTDPEVLLSYHNAHTVNFEGVHIGTLAARAAHKPILDPISSGPWWPFPLGFSEVLRSSLLQFSDQWPNSVDPHDNGQRMAHDQWFFFLASVFGKIAYLEEPLVGHVQHGQNTYGWRDLTLREWIQRFFRARVTEFTGYIVAADSRTVILETLKARLDGSLKLRAAAAIDYYRTVSWLYARRNTLYTSANFFERLGAFRDVLGKGGYAGPWGLGRRSFVSDMFLGLPIGHVFRSAC